MPIISNPVQVTKFRQYFLEYSIIALAGAVVTLFLMFNDLNKYIRDQQNKIIIEVTEALNKNTNVLIQNETKKKFE